MAKIPAAQDRLYKNVFVCKKCGTKIKSDIQKILEERIKCRRCNSKTFRPISKRK